MSTFTRMPILRRKVERPWFAPSWIEAMTKAQAARRFKTTAKTVAKWLGRFRAEGIAGL